MIGEELYRTQLSKQRNQVDITRHEKNRLWRITLLSYVMEKLLFSIRLDQQRRPCWLWSPHWSCMALTTWPDQVWVLFPWSAWGIGAVFLRSTLMVHSLLAERNVASWLEGLAGAEGLLLASCLHDSATSAMQLPQHQITTPPVATLGEHCLAARQDMLEVCFDGHNNDNTYSRLHDEGEQCVEVERLVVLVVDDRQQFV